MLSFRAAAKLSAQTKSKSRASCWIAISRVRSEDPVSTTTMSSIKPSTDRKHGPRLRSSFLAIMHNETWAAGPDNSFPTRGDSRGRGESDVAMGVRLALPDLFAIRVASLRRVCNSLGASARIWRKWCSPLRKSVVARNRISASKVRSHTASGAFDTASSRRRHAPITSPPANFRRAAMPGQIVSRQSLPSSLISSASASARRSCSKSNSTSASQAGSNSGVRSIASCQCASASAESPSWRKIKAKLWRARQPNLASTPK